MRLKRSRPEPKPLSGRGGGETAIETIQEIRRQGRELLEEEGGVWSPSKSRRPEESASEKLQQEKFLDMYEQPPGAAEQRAFEDYEYEVVLP